MMINNNIINIVVHKMFKKIVVITKINNLFTYSKH